MRKLTRVVACLLFTAILSSCTGAQVQDWFARRGQTIDWETGHAIAVQINQAVALRRYLQAVAIPYEANWDRVAACESGGNWATNTGNGYFGGVQFSLPTWRSVGGTGYPHQHSKAEQIRRAEILRHRAGLGQWPVCGRRWHG